MISPSARVARARRRPSTLCPTDSRPPQRRWRRQQRPRRRRPRRRRPRRRRPRRRRPRRRRPRRRRPRGRRRRREQRAEPPQRRRRRPKPPQRRRRWPKPPQRRRRRPKPSGAERRRPAAEAVRKTAHPRPFPAKDHAPGKSSAGGAAGARLAALLLPTPDPSLSPSSPQEGPINAAVPTNQRIFNGNGQCPGGGPKVREWGEREEAQRRGRADPRAHRPAPSPAGLQRLEQPAVLSPDQLLVREWRRGGAGAVENKTRGRAAARLFFFRPPSPPPSPLSRVGGWTDPFGCVWCVPGFGGWGASWHVFFLSSFPPQPPPFPPRRSGLYVANIVVNSVAVFGWWNGGCWGRRRGGRRGTRRSAAAPASPHLPRPPPPRLRHLLLQQQRRRPVPSMHLLQRVPVCVVGPVPGRVVGSVRARRAVPRLLLLRPLVR